MIQITAGKAGSPVSQRRTYRNWWCMIQITAGKAGSQYHKEPTGTGGA